MHFLFNLIVTFWGVPAGDSCCWIGAPHTWGGVLFAFLRLCSFSVINKKHLLSWQMCLLLANWKGAFALWWSSYEVQFSRKTVQVWAAPQFVRFSSSAAKCLGLTQLCADVWKFCYFLEKLERVYLTDLLKEEAWVGWTRHLFLLPVVPEMSQARRKVPGAVGYRMMRQVVGGRFRY